MRTGRVIAVALLGTLLAMRTYAQIETVVDDGEEEPSSPQVTFVPVSETWAANVFDLSIHACAVQMPRLSFSADSAVYRLRPGELSSSTLGEATVLKRPEGLKEGTLTFLIGRGRDREQVPCEGAGVLYGDLPSSAVTFRLTHVEGNLTCVRIESEVGE
jgi:hypothetical protein